MYQKNVTSSPRRVLLIISSTDMSEPSMTRLLLTVVGVGSFFCWSPTGGRNTRFLRTPFSIQVTSRGGRPVGADRRLAQNRVADVAPQREHLAEDLLADLGRAAFLAAEVIADRALRGARALKSAQHQRQEPCRWPRLEDHGVAAGLERARLLALERLVGRGLGELHGVDQARVLDPGNACPARAGAVFRAAP